MNFRERGFSHSDVGDRNSNFAMSMSLASLSNQRQRILQFLVEAMWCLAQYIYMRQQPWRSGIVCHGFVMQSFMIVRIKSIRYSLVVGSFTSWFAHTIFQTAVAFNYFRVHSACAAEHCADLN